MNHARPAYLNNLNPAQHRAIVHDPKIPLQILAGPGSGKTRVLTSRVAHLVEHHGLRPESICAVTFTNKAANEMRERLQKIIGRGPTLSLVMGTFHAICAKYLRIHGPKISLPTNFSICDKSHSDGIINELLRQENYVQAIKQGEIKLQNGQVATAISHCKAKGISHKTFSEKAATYTDTVHGRTQRLIGDLYRDYQKALRESNSLDFDDLLVYGVKLLRAHPNVVLGLRHVLVDEFQDTNIMQFELMCLLSSANRCVSIVGDPDQSIYGWRAAEIANLAKMERKFEGTQQIYLEENYRSTGAILKASLDIISKDRDRIPKSLFTSRPLGPTPALLEAADAWEESNVFAQEIKRVIAHSGGKLTYNDVAILVRFNALSRPIEEVFRRHGIPCVILGGHKFFDRAEVKDLIAYLQLVDNPDFTPAFKRAVNVPKRGLGAKSLQRLGTQATAQNISPMQLAENIVAGRSPDLKPAIKSKIAPFVAVISTLRALSRQDVSAEDLLRKLIDLVDYKKYLEESDGWEQRWENVKELITFATEVSKGEDPVSSASAEVEGEADGTDGRVTTPLRQFLEASMLSTDAQTEAEEDNKPKVTISTCHAAKGLEWPMVIVPSVEEGVFPFTRTENIAEERRLLYVACTRAQGFLYLTHVKTRPFAGEMKAQNLSRFVQEVMRDGQVNSFVTEPPSLGPDNMATMFEILQRTPPQQSEIDACLATLKAQTWTVNLIDRKGHLVSADLDKELPPAPIAAAFYGAGQTLGGQWSGTSRLLGSLTPAASVPPVLGGFSSAASLHPVVGALPPIVVKSEPNASGSAPLITAFGSTMIPAARTTATTSRAAIRKTSSSATYQGPTTSSGAGPSRRASNLAVFVKVEEADNEVLEIPTLSRHIHSSHNQNLPRPDTNPRRIKDEPVMDESPSGPLRTRNNARPSAPRVKVEEPSQSSRTKPRSRHHEVIVIDSSPPDDVCVKVEEAFVVHPSPAIAPLPPHQGPSRMDATPRNAPPAAIPVKSELPEDNPPRTAHHQTSSGIGNKRLGMRGPLKPFGAPKEKKPRTK